MSIEEDALPSSFIQLFNHAKRYRSTCGAEEYIKNCESYFNCNENTATNYDEDVKGILIAEVDNQCVCNKSSGEMCDLCQVNLDEVSIQEDQSTHIESKYRGISNLLLNTKLDQYKSQIQNPYIPLGDKIFLMRPQGSPEITDAVVERAAIDLQEAFNNFIQENEITVDVLPSVIPFNTTRALYNAIGREVESSTMDELVRNVNDEQDEMLKIVSQTDLASKYLTCLYDMFYYGIFGLWTDEEALVEVEDTSSGKLKYKNKTLPWVSRVDPKYFWYTKDYFGGSTDKAVFKLEKMSEPMLLDVMNKSNSSLIKENIKQFLDSNVEYGYCSPSTMLFQHDAQFQQGLYDVIVGRSYFSVEDLKVYDTPLVETMLREYVGETFLPVEIWYSAGKILNIKPLSKISPNLGVYTSTFRGTPERPVGKPLWEYIEPFTKGYEKAFIALDKDTARLQGLIIMIDTASGAKVASLGDENLSQDSSGVIKIDLVEDTIFEWDSSSVGATTKGTPIEISPIRTIANEAVAVMAYNLSQIPIVTGIDELLTSGDNISSSLRTNENFNQALDNSKNSIKTLLRTPDKEILQRTLNFFFNYRRKKGLVSQIVLDNDIKILTLDEINTEYVDGRRKLQDTVELSQFNYVIPEGTQGELVNQLGKETYNLESDLVPNSSELSNNASSTAEGGI